MGAARVLWAAVEPFHAVAYFAPEVRARFQALGVRGYWRGYFAGRAGPMGAVGPGVVTATFYGYHPDFVRRAVPEIWSIATPKAAVDARLAGVDDAFRRLGIADRRQESGLAADLLRAAVEGCMPSGRPLFAAHAELPWPDEPHLALWHAATLLREHRGDGHVAALVAAEVGPCEAHVLRTAADGSDPQTVQAHRGWDDGAWAAAQDALRSRGWLDDAGALTDLGRAQHLAVEAQTDQLADGPVARLGDDLARVVGALESMVGQLHRVAEG